jgi:hypothetical protein
MSIRTRACLPLLAVLIVAPLAPGTLPAASVTASAPKQKVQSLTFSADCTAMPGRLRVRVAKRVAANGYSVTMRGTGLPTGLDWAGLSYEDADGQHSSMFDPDPSSRGVRHRVSVPASWTGTTGAMVTADEGAKICNIGSRLLPSVIQIGANSVTLDVTRSNDWLVVGVGSVPCRGSQAVRGRVVLRFAHRTVRTRLHPTRCLQGAASLSIDLTSASLPRAVSAVVRARGRTWHVAYNRRLG